MARRLLAANTQYVSVVSPSSSIADTIQAVPQVGTFQPPEQHEALFVPLWPTTHLTGLTAHFRDDGIHIREL